MNAKYDLVILDCDGTLVDSEGIAAQVLSEILTEMGFDKYTPQYCYKEFASISFESVVIALQLELGKSFNPELFLAKAQKRMSQQLDNKLLPMKGAHELLTSLNNFPKCVASNGKMDYVIQALDTTGLLPFFKKDEIFTFHQVGVPKPAPDLFLFAANQMGFNEASRCLVVEDSDTGITAANKALMDVVVVERYNNPRQQMLGDLKIKGFIQDLRELEKFIW